MPFSNLPVEVLPFIIQHVLRPSHLAQVCLVNKDFHVYTVPQLYERPAIFAWHREAKNKATQLFWTLANCPKLARYVRRLELRDFPKALSRDNTYKLAQLCVSGLANCVNLTCCIWTRDGSLKDDILEALSRCPSLQAIEINGRHGHNYDPSLLHKFEKLRRISVIMPTTEVVHALSVCFERNLETLQELTIICKFTSVVTDAWIESMAPSLSRLKKLHLAGCPKITHEGMIHLLRANVVGLSDLALEGVSPSFDMKDFAASISPSLSRLTSVTLTFPVAGVTCSWLSDVEVLLFNAVDLKQFHLYASGDWRKKSVPLDTGFVWRLIERHRARLTRFAVLRIPMSLGALGQVVSSAEKLEQLFVTLWKKDLGKLGPIVAQSRTLRSLHVSYTYNTVADRENLVSSNTNANASVYTLPLNINPRSLTRDDDDDDDGDDDDGSDDDDDDITSDEDEEGGLNSLFSLHSEETEDPRFVSSGQRGTQNPLPSMAELEKLASQFGEKLTQFGIQTRVWQVERIFCAERDGAGGERARQRVRLTPYESPDVPDVFLVVRT